MRSSLSLCSDVAGACRLTLSKQLDILKGTGGDCCTQTSKFEQKWQLSVRITTNAYDQKWSQQRVRTIIELMLF